jgi:small subunit ribosomal protein S8
MVVTDPIADMLTRIRNAITVRHDRVAVPASNLKIELARLLKEEGFIVNYDVLKSGTPQAFINIYLHYRDRNIPAIVGLKRVSKPGLRVYVGKGEIPRLYGGLGVALLSTSEGVMTGKQAWRKGVGGELLCYVW